MLARDLLMRLNGYSRDYLWRANRRDHAETLSRASVLNNRGRDSYRDSNIPFLVLNVHFLHAQDQA